MAGGGGGKFFRKCAEGILDKLRKKWCAQRQCFFFAILKKPEQQAVTLKSPLPPLAWNALAGVTALVYADSSFFML